MKCDGLDFGEIGEGEKDEVADYRGRNNAVAYVLGKVDRSKKIGNFPNMMLDLHRNRMYICGE